MGDHDVGTAGSVAPGEALVVELEGREVAVFNLDGEYHALLNWCAHQGGPACEGPVGGTYEARFDPATLTVEREWVRDGRVVTCPWHGWEYDIASGDCLSDPSVHLPTYPVRVEEGRIVVTL